MLTRRRGSWGTVSSLAVWDAASGQLVIPAIRTGRQMRLPPQATRTGRCIFGVTDVKRDAFRFEWRLSKALLAVARSSHVQQEYGIRFQ